MPYLTADHKEKSKKKPNYRRFQALYLAFFSSNLYVDVVRRWRGIGLIYLLMMLSIFSLPYASILMLDYYQNITQKILTPIKALPPFVVRSGTVHFHGPMPYLVKNNQNQVIAAIDTAGTIKNLPSFRHPEASVLVSKHAIHLYIPLSNRLAASGLFQDMMPEEDETLITFGKNENINFVGDEWLKNGAVQGLIYTLCALIYLIMVSAYFGLYVLFLLTFGLFGQLIAKLIFKVHLSFLEATRLIAVASTPQAAVYFGFLAFNKIFSGAGIFYLGLLAATFSFAVIAYRNTNRSIVLS